MSDGNADVRCFDAAARAEVIQCLVDEHEQGVMTTKGVAYSRNEPNINSNFFRVAEAVGTNPLTTCLTYMLKHMDAISAWVAKGTTTGVWDKLVGGEPVEGRIGDAKNYLSILYSIAVQQDILDDPRDVTLHAFSGSE